MDLTPLLERLRTGGFHDFAGGEAFAKLPLREGLVNALLETTVLPRVAALRALRIVFHDGNRLDLVLTFSSRWLPAMTLPLDLDPHVTMDPSPKVSLHMRDSGLMGRLGPFAGALSDRLPPGVRLDKRLIEIDIATLVGPYDTMGLLRLLQQARLTTATGVLWVDAAVVVPTPELPAAGGAGPS